MVSTSGAVHRMPAEKCAEPPIRSAFSSTVTLQAVLGRGRSRGQSGLSSAHDN